MNEPDYDSCNESEDDDSPLCDCGVVEHTIDEVDWNRCGCCGKRIE